MSKIVPTVGRVVWYYPTDREEIATSSNAKHPLAAISTPVWFDSCVNLAVFDVNGVNYSRTSVLLVQEGEPSPFSGYCEWMPYQKGQAAKTDALEAVLRGREIAPRMTQPEVFDFGVALERLRGGSSVRRAGWNGKGLKVTLQRPDEHSRMTLPYLYIEYPSDNEHTPGARCPWLASQTDILAQDWSVVPWDE